MVARAGTSRRPVAVLQVITINILTMAGNDFFLPRRDMARGLAKLEGELTRVGSWAAMRRDKEEAYR